MKIKVLEELEDEFRKFCKLNEIEDINKEAYNCFISGFNVRKYGPTPIGQKEVVEKVVEVEKIIEKIIEKEVPITDDVKIQEFIKEIENLKNNYNDLQGLTNEKDNQIKALSSQTQFYKTQISGLQKEMEKRTGPLQRLMRGDFLRGSKLNNNLYDD